MGPHKVIAAFRHRDQLIEPPGKWTPPNEASAAKLIAAGCLKAPKGDPEVAAEPEPEAPADEPTADTPPPADEPKDKPKGKGGKRGRR